MSGPWPCVVVSTVVRGAPPGAGHGALWVVDLALDESRLLLRWDETALSFAGRGGDRGLRGVVVWRDRIIVAASDALLVLDPTGRLRSRHRCPYLGLAHELTVREGMVYVASTAHDSVLAFDPVAEDFVWGLCLRGEEGPGDGVFDPRQPGGPPAGDTLHLNQVHSNAAGLWLSCHRRHWLLCLADGALRCEDCLPLGTHNARRLPDGRLLFSDTARDAVVLREGDRVWRRPVPRRPARELAATARCDPRLARPGFARGLLWLGDDRAVGGFSPAGVAGYTFDGAGPPGLGPVHWLSADVAHAVHGVALWPFDDP